MFEFDYIKYKLSNLFIFPVCLIAVMLSDFLIIIDNDYVELAANLISVMILIVLYNRLSNILFRGHAIIDVSKDDMKITLGHRQSVVKFDDIKEISLVFASQLFCTYCEFTIKTVRQKYKINTVRYYKGEELKLHPLSEAFMKIRNKRPDFKYTSDLDGTLLRLKASDEAS